VDCRKTDCRKDEDIKEFTCGNAVFVSDLINQYTYFSPVVVISPNRDEATGEWRKLSNEELSDLYSLPNVVRVVKSRRMRWAGHVARMGEGRGVYRVMVGYPEGKRPLGETQT
jgi:hypothetical protein